MGSPFDEAMTEVEVEMACDRCKLSAADRAHVLVRHKESGPQVLGDWMEMMKAARLRQPDPVPDRALIEAAYNRYVNQFLFTKNLSK